MFHDDQQTFSWPSAVTLAPAPPAVEGRPWRLSDVFVGCGLLVTGLVAAIAVGVALAALGRPVAGPGVVLLFTVVTLVVELWMGVVVVGLAMRRGISSSVLGFRAPSHWWLLPAAVFGAYGSIAGYGVTIMAIEWATGVDLSSFRSGNPIPGDVPRTPMIWGTLGIALVVAAPFGEELFFRGLIYRGLAGIVGPTFATIVSSAAFAAVHFNISVVVPFTFIGMVFALVYRVSGSLWPSIAAHAIVNGASFVLFTVYGIDS